MKTRMFVPGLVALGLMVSACGNSGENNTNSAGEAGQQEEQAEVRRFNVGLTGSENPQGLVSVVDTARRPDMQALIVRLAEKGPLPVAEVESALADMELGMPAMQRLGIFAVRDGRVHIAFNYLDRDDQLLLIDIGRRYGRHLADMFIERWDELERLSLAADPDTQKPLETLFFFVGAMMMDWEGLGWTIEHGYRPGALVEGEGYAYTLWMKEATPDVSLKGFYWGSHNNTQQGYTITTFGDHHSLPRVAIPDMFFSIGNPFPVLEGRDDLELAGRRFYSLHRQPMRDTLWTTLLALAEGPKEVSEIADLLGGERQAVWTLDLLDKINFVRREGDTYALDIVFVDGQAADEVAALKALTGEVFREFHDLYFEAQKAEHTGLKAMKHGVPFGVIYTETWHFIFGYANLYLVEDGLMADPYAGDREFKGFIPYMWDAGIDDGEARY